MFWFSVCYNYIYLFPSYTLPQMALKLRGHTTWPLSYPASHLLPDSEAQPFKISPIHIPTPARKLAWPFPSSFFPS